MHLTQSERELSQGSRAGDAGGCHLTLLWRWDDSGTSLSGPSEGTSNFCSYNGHLAFREGWGSLQFSGGRAGGRAGRLQADASSQSQEKLADVLNFHQSHHLGV